MRTETRQQRYQKKAIDAKSFPISIATVNFVCDGNVAYLSRSLACFAGETMHVIGRMPSNADLNRLSGGLSKLIKYHSHKNPAQFIEYCRLNQYKIVSAELTDGSNSIFDLNLNINQKYMFVIGHEMDGVPTEILHRSDQIIHIPMPGIGYCLNASQVGNIILYEYSRKFYMNNR